MLFINQSGPRAARTQTMDLRDGVSCCRSAADLRLAWPPVTHLIQLKGFCCNCSVIICLELPVRDAVFLAHSCWLFNLEMQLQISPASYATCHQTALRAECLVDTKFEIPLIEYQTGQAPMVSRHVHCDEHWSLIQRIVGLIADNYFDLHSTVSLQRLS